MNDKIPIVPGFTKTFEQAAVPCPFCGHIHRHGTAPGARLSHCIGIETKQYELRFVVGPLPEVYRLLERQIRKRADHAMHNGLKCRHYRQGA